MLTLFFGTNFINLCWPQAEVLLIYHSFTWSFADFLQTNVSVNIHEYANKLICLFEYQMKWQCRSFNLVPTLLLYVEHRLSYD